VITSELAKLADIKASAHQTTSVSKDDREFDIRVGGNELQDSHQQRHVSEEISSGAAFNRYSTCHIQPRVALLQINTAEQRQNIFSSYIHGV
jgi:hypothetical protein